MKIKNFDNLAVNPLRKAALEISEAAFLAIDTKTAVQKNVALSGDDLIISGDTVSLVGIKRLFVIAIGKCAIDSSLALEEILGERLTGGFAFDIREGKLNRMKAIKGDHPFASEENIKITEGLIDFLEGLNELDFVLFSISGGGSALICCPNEIGIPEEDRIFRHLFKSGAVIEEINIIRKHLSLARGGNLTRAVYPAKSASIIFSDVPGNNMEFIASGPTVKDTTTIEDAKRVLEKYGIGDQTQGLIETPKDDKYFENTKAFLMVSNDLALKAMELKSNELGYATKIITNVMKGEAREKAKEILEELRKESNNTCLLYGGETTVTVKGNGKGGRNQEFCLSLVDLINPHEIIMAVASDGKDNGDFGGAICDIITKNKAEELKLNPKTFLDENNSSEFFQKVGDYLLTGPTGSNVSDLIIAIKE